MMSRAPTSILIHAATYWNPTQFELLSGHAYRLTAAGKWIDFWIPSGPDGYLSPTVYMRWFEHLRRASRQKWFALMGAFEKNDDEAFLIGSDALVRPSRDGTLWCLANDVAFGYWNNWGHVSLSIEEVPQTSAG